MSRSHSPNRSDLIQQKVLFGAEKVVKSYKTTIAINSCSLLFKTAYRKLCHNQIETANYLDTFLTIHEQAAAIIKPQPRK